MSESQILSILIGMEETSRSFFEKHQFDYNPKDEHTVKRLEELIQSLFPVTTKLAAEDFLPLGYYLGQVITHNIPGAYWDEVSDHTKIPEELTITISLKGLAKSKLMLYPMRRVARFICNHEDSILSFYELTKQIVAKSIDLSNTSLNQTYTQNALTFEVRSDENK